MSRRRFGGLFVAVVLLVCLIGAVVAYVILARQVNLAAVISPAEEAQVQVPEGFAVNVFASGLSAPRFITFGPDEQLYVAERGAGRIVRLPDVDGNGAADEVEIVAGDLESPHSVVIHEGDWFVGVPTGVVRLGDRDGDGAAENREIIVSDYPTSGHNTRTVLFLPDGQMVVSVGSSCNVCEEEDPRRAAIVAYDGPAGQSERIFASGLRNAVGLTLQPETGELWASNNGRDFMGDDLPPETIYRLREGVDYGWPSCHSGDIPDPEFGIEGACDSVPEPEVEMQAHSAPLGLTFYDGESFPAAYHGDLFVAFHGSWNRSVPTGYSVVRIPFADGEVAGAVEDFATGWLNRETNAVDGRPVGLAVGPDGALYVSDDKGGFIYRIYYTGG